MTADHPMPADDQPQPHAIRRLIEACVDATDCLTRAAALYAQHYSDAREPLRGVASEVSAPGKPESRPPSTGDLQVIRALHATRRNVIRAANGLSNAGIHPHPQDRVVAMLADDVRPAVLEAAVIVVCRRFSYVEASAARLSGKQRRQVFMARRSAFNALAAWDTPVVTDAVRKARGRLAEARADGDALAVDQALRDLAEASSVALDEHGTAVRPPSQWDPHARRCKRKDCRGDDGRPRLMGKRRGEICDACAKRDSRANRKAS